MFVTEKMENFFRATKILSKKQKVKVKVFDNSYREDLKTPKGVSKEEYYNQEPKRYN
jgi:hypothetical protein